MVMVWEGGKLQFYIKFLRSFFFGKFYKAFGCKLPKTIRKLCNYTDVSDNVWTPLQSPTIYLKNHSETWFFLKLFRNCFWNDEIMKKLRGKSQTKIPHLPNIKKLFNKNHQEFDMTPIHRLMPRQKNDLILEESQ